MRSQRIKNDNKSYPMGSARRTNKNSEEEGRRLLGKVGYKKYIAKKAQIQTYEQDSREK
jgi:hypothetical protein